MPLGPGARLGPYEILSALGAGGMGEVYRARDTKLDREVAIKVLPEAFAADTDRIARFQREAKTLASLNHPHIAAIYGIEESGGTHALVMELVDGEDLSQRIARGPISLDEALPIAKQIAEALEAAHEQGVIHRDLKPANIKLRNDGTVKVLDFGLAKLTEPVGIGQSATTGAALSLSPTITSPAMMTGVGVLLGTAAYMAPEQAKGKPADKRSDIWAFGCVLYEMLTGVRPFEGDDAADILAFILTRDVDFTKLPSGLPVVVRTLIRRCLERNRNKRLSDVGGALFVLDNLGALTDVTHLHHGTVGIPRRLIVVVASICALLGGAAAGIWTWIATRPVASTTVRSELSGGGPLGLRVQGNDRDVAITPDGMRVVYRGTNQILVRRLDQLQPSVLLRAPVPRGLFISPDSRWVGFFDDTNGLKKVPITGGPAISISQSDGGTPRGAAWGPDGTIIFTTNAPSTGLLRVPASGGPVTVLTKPNPAADEADHWWPQFLPGGNAVLFTIASRKSGLDDARIAVLDLKTGAYKILVRGGTDAHYLPSGHLVYMTNGTLRAVPFNLSRLEVTGEPLPILEQVVMTGDGAMDLSIADNGTVVYLPGQFATVDTLVWVDRDGHEEPLPLPARAYRYVRISPDGHHIAIDIRDQEFDIWMYDINRQTLTRLTFDPALDLSPQWTPDGRRIVFASQRSNAGNLFIQPADGTGSPERLTDTLDGADIPASVAPDGTRVVFRQINPNTGQDLMILPLTGHAKAQPLIQTRFSETNGEVSPDGRWIAYQSSETGRDEIYVRPFPDVKSGQWQISTAGGSMPMWSRDDRELFYLAPEEVLMGVTVDAASTWHHGIPKPIVTGPYQYIPTNNGRTGGGSNGRVFDISPDGKRFLLMKQGSGGSSASASTNLVLIQNWFEEVKRLVPVN